MDKFLDKFLNQYVTSIQFDDTSKLEISKHLSVIDKRKNSVLVQENNYTDFAYFIIKGAIRAYYLKDGVEINTWFALENEMVASFNNYQSKPSNVTLELVEDCKLIAINLRTLKPILNHSAQISNFVRAIIEEYTEFLEDRLYATQFMSSLDRYAYLLENDPEVIQRIPLTYIASYLGISRETLSRIRGK
jgi:CRP/FNR family transcriptional regulator, anaerobic regulatory protein